MELEYNTLFDVEILHNYYDSGIAEDFTITPAGTCRQDLLDHGLLFRTTPKGFAVLYGLTRNDNGSPQPLRPLEKALKLSFAIASANPYLTNFSNLPLDGGNDQVYHLHNLNDNPQGGKFLLTSERTSDRLTQHDRIKLKPQSFQYTSKVNTSQAEIDVVNDTGKMVLKKLVETTEGIISCPVNLKDGPPGKFILKVEGTRELEFYASNELMSKSIFAVIDVFFTDNVPDAYRLIDDDNKPLPKTYTLRIDRRETYWRYYVVMKYRTDTSSGDLSITSPDISGSPVVFEKQSRQQISDGTKAVPFVSNRPIPFRQSPVKGVQLKKANGSGGSGIFEIDNLPNPSVAALKPDGSTNKVYSEIFVYI